MLTISDIEYINSYDLSQHTTIRMGPCVRSAFPLTVTALASLVDYAEREGQLYYVLGAMSNTLPPMADNGALYIFTTKLRGSFATEDCIAFESGYPFVAAIRECVARSVYLMPSLIGIPGTLGGAVYSNAGAFGECIGEALYCAEVYDVKANRTLLLSKEDMEFSYRHSRLKNDKMLLLRVYFEAKSRYTKEEFYRLRNKAIAARRATQPHEPSLGSVFKRRGDLSVSALIDTLGFKGRQIGGIRVSDKHAGFFLNVGGGTSNDFLALLHEVSEGIRKCYGFLTEPEITIL